MKKLLLLLFIPAVLSAQVWTNKSPFDTVALSSVNNIYRSWKPLTGLDNNTGALQVNADSTASPTNTTAGQLQSGSGWNLTFNDTSYFGIVIKQVLYNAPNQTLVLCKASTLDNNEVGYRIRWNKDNGTENIQLQRFTSGTVGTTLVTKNLSSAGAANDTLYMKVDSNYTYTEYWKHTTGAIDSAVAVDSTYKMKSGWYVWVRGLIGSPPLKLKSLIVAPLVRIAPPPPPTSDTATFSSMSTTPLGTAGQVPIVDSLQFNVTAQDLFSNLTKIVVRQDGVRKDSITGLSQATKSWTSKRIFAGNRGANHTYDFIATSTVPNSYTSAQQSYFVLNDTGVTWFQVAPALSGLQDTVQLKITAFDYFGIKYLLAYLNGSLVDSIWYGLSPVVSNPSWTTKKLAAGTLNITQNYYFKAVTDSGLSRTSPTFSYTPTNKRYWSTVHLENWFIGTIPATAIPFQWITNLIMFDGRTFGALTNGVPPESVRTYNGFYGPPTNINTAYWQQVISLAHAAGVQMELDGGTNSNNGYTAVCQRGAAGQQTWAGTVAHAIIQYNFDGLDFDAEGGSPYPPNGGMGEMARLLKDSLTALNPAKKYYLTMSLMPNIGDCRGYLTGNSGASAATVAASAQYFDQINPMAYDMCFPTPSPLFPSSTHPCWGNDSSIAQSYVTAGVPKAKVGLGYAIQVYNGCASCIVYMNSPGVSNGPPSNIVLNGTHFFDNESKEAWSTLNGTTIAYEDTNTGFWKADFIKRQGYGGAMGFCLGRGYIANPPPGVDPNMAVRGIGQNLLAGGTVLPPPSPPSVTNPVGSPSDTLRAIDTLTFVWTSVSGASSYQLQVATDVNFNTIVIDRANSSNFYTLTGSGIALQNGTFYWVKVNATVSGQTSIFSNAVKFRTLTKTVSTPPSAPTLATPAQGSTGQPKDFLTFYWRKNAAADSVTSYTFQLATDRLFTNIIWPVPQLADTNTAVSGLNYSTWYYWRVYAFKQTLSSVASVTDSFQTVAQTTPPNPPTIWNPPNNSTGKSVDTVLFSWSPDVLAQSYHIQISTDNLFTAPYVDQIITQASFTPGKAFKLNYNTLYYWRVQVSTANGTSVYANAQVTTQQQPAAVNPLAPVLNTPTQGQTGLGTTITFSWTTLTSDSASSFQFIVGRRRTLDTTGLTGLDFNLVSPAPSFTNVGQQVISGLTPLTWYYWRVQTNKGALKSVWSVLDSFQTAAPPVVGKGSIFYPFGVDPNGGSAPVVTNPPFLTLQYQAGYVPPYLADTNAVQLIGRGTYRAGVFTPFGGSGSGGGITGVTASLPLASSLNNPPDISLVGIVPIANGGLGKGTWTNKSIPYFNGLIFTEDNNNLQYSVVDTTLRVNRLYADNTTAYTDRAALVTINRNDSTKHLGIWSSLYIIEKSRGDSGLTFSGNGAIYARTYEDTTLSGLTRRKRGVLYGLALDLVPYTENNPYTANMDVTGITFANKGSVMATEAAYIGGSNFIPATASNPNRYAWSHGIRFVDTMGAGLSYAGVENIGIDMASLGTIGSNPRAIKTATTAQSDFGTMTWGGATIDSALTTASTQGAHIGRGLLVGASVTAPQYYGGSSSGGNVLYGSTSHATKGFHLFGGTTNARVAIDETNARLGIGTDAPASTIHTQNSDGLWLDDYYGSGFPYILTREAVGTLGSPTATTAGKNILVIGGRGYDGSSFGNNDQVRITATSTQTFTTANRGTKLSFGITHNNQSNVTTALTLDTSGYVGLGTANPATSNTTGTDGPVFNILSSTSAIPELRLENTANSSFVDFNMYAKTGSTAMRFRIINNGNPGFDFNVVSNHSMDFKTNNTQVGRFTAGGTFNVGSASQFGVNASGVPANSNNVALEGEGFPTQHDTVMAGGQTGTIGNTNLNGTATNGLYRVSIYIYPTTAGTSGTVSGSIKWNDGAAETATTANHTFGALGTPVSLIQLCRVTNSTAITWNTTVTAAVGNPVYECDVVAERLW